MPRIYKIKEGAPPKATWSEENLRSAMETVKNGTLTVNRVSKQYNIPHRTLKRRLDTGNMKKVSLGKPPALGVENEKRV